VGDRTGLAFALIQLASFLHEEDADQATSLFERGLEVARELADEEWSAAARMMALTNLGDLALRRRDYEEAIALSREGLAVSDARGNDQVSTANLQNIAVALLELGRAEEAALCLAESIERAERANYSLGVAWGLAELATTAIARADFERGIQLAAAGAKLLDAVGASLGRIEQEVFDGALQEARAALGDESFERAWSAGRALTAEQARSEALLAARNAPSVARCRGEADAVTARSSPDDANRKFPE
jgi:tetratricopeptide (TPR) repeat protein